MTAAGATAPSEEVDVAGSEVEPHDAKPSAAVLVQPLGRLGHPGQVAYGHHGGMPGFTTVAVRTEPGRCVVVWKNGIDMHNPLSSDAPFVQAALAG